MKTNCADLRQKSEWSNKGQILSAALDHSPTAHIRVTRTLVVNASKLLGNASDRCRDPVGEELLPRYGPSTQDLGGKIAGVTAGQCGKLSLNEIFEVNQLAHLVHNLWIALGHYIHKLCARGIVFMRHIIV